MAGINLQTKKTILLFFSITFAIATLVSAGYLVAMKLYPTVIIAHSPIRADVLRVFAKNSDTGGPNLWHTYRSRIRESGSAFESTLIQGLEPANPESIRVAAATGLAEIDSIDATEAMRFLVNDSNGDVVKAAVWYLSRTLTPENYIQTITPLLSSKDARILGAVLKTLSRLPVNCEREILIVATTTKDLEILVQCILAMKLHGGADAVRFLTELLNKPSTPHLVAMQAKNILDYLRAGKGPSHSAGDPKEPFQ